MALEKGPTAYKDDWILVPCGKCLACRINRRREWTQRLLHEAADSDTVYFLTLTYSDEYLPGDENGQQRVSKEDVQKFLQDLRNACRSDKVSIRYFVGSEYGDLGRPHYHAIVYNMPSRFVSEPSKDWLPGLPLQTSHKGRISYVNRKINDVWRRGFVSVGEFNRQRAGYVAKYFVDKQEVPDGCEKNFSLMSRRPGIGFRYAEAISDKVRYYGLHSCMADNGKYLPLPRYYDRKIFSDEEREQRFLQMDIRSYNDSILARSAHFDADIAENQIKAHHKGYKKQL